MWNSAIGFILLAACAQVFVSVLIKNVSNSTSIGVQLAFYYIIPILTFTPIIIKKGVKIYKTKMFHVHFIRGSLSIASVGCFFYAIKYIPLGIATTLFNMIPLFVPLISQVFLKEKISGKIYFGLCVALTGVLLIINPTASRFSISHFMIGLSAALLMASSMVLLAYLTRKGESVDQIVFHQYTSCSLIALGLVSFSQRFFANTDTGINMRTWLFLFGLGVLSIGIQYCFSKAAQRASLSRCAPFLYFSVPLSSVLGFLFWQQSLSIGIIIGSCLIFAGLCICVLHFNKVPAAAP